MKMKDRSPIHIIMLIVALGLTIIFITTYEWGCNKKELEQNPRKNGSALGDGTGSSAHKERKYVLDGKSFNVVLVDTSWTRIEFSQSVRKLGMEYNFIQPDSSSYMEIRIDGSEIVIKDVPDDGWITLGRPAFVLIRGRGVIEFTPNPPAFF